MKKYLLIALSVVALAFTSCAEFLKPQPEGSPTKEQYFTNDQQAEQAVLALYSRMSQEAIYGRNIFWEQAGANDIVFGRESGSRVPLATLNPTGDTGNLRDIYRYCMQWIASSQWVIQGLEAKRAQTELTAVEERSLGEAYFLRGLWHFIVAYRHGKGDLGVPFKPWEEYEGDYNNEMPPQQPSVTNNYAYIVADFKKAEEFLPWKGSITATYDEANRGRAHKVSAIAYQAKVLAYWATWDKTKWDEVITLVNKLEKEYGRDLAPTFAELWSAEFADFWNAECCYSIPSTGGAMGGPIEFGGIIVENKGWGKFNGWGQMKPTLDIYNEMAKDNWETNEDGSVKKNDRLAKSILEYGDKFMYFGEERLFWSTSDIEAGFMINKYMDALKHSDPEGMGYLVPNADWPCTRVNFHLLRFADLKLLRAEAYLNKQQGDKAADDINDIRLRSNLKPLTGNATWTDLYHERRCELAFEMADHLHDLKRWAVSGDPEIKALAIAELEKHPDVRNHEDRANPHSAWVKAPYADYQTPAKQWVDAKIAFPYPADEITAAGGAYKQVVY